MPLTSSSAPIFSWYDVPLDLKQLLQAAAQAWEKTDQADCLMEEILAHPAVNLDVLVSAYRYYFYRHNNLMAQRSALAVMDRVRQQEKLPETWEYLQPQLRDRAQDPSIRLYLNAYSALGLIKARMGDVTAAEAIASHIQSIDDRNEFGAKIILNILFPIEED